MYRKLRDHCEICGGTRGGVRGNENIVQSCGESVVMCDYCSTDDYLQPGFWKEQPDDSPMSGEAAACYVPSGEWEDTQ